MFASLLIQLSLFASGVITARALGVTDRGRLAAMMILPPLVVQFFGIGQPTTLTYFTARGASIRRLARQSVRVAFFQSAIGVIVLLGLAQVVVDSRVRTVAYMGAGAVPLLLGYQLIIAMMQGNGDYRAFSWLRAAPSALYAVAAGVAALASPDVAWFMGAWLLSIFASAATASVVLWRSAAPTEDGSALVPSVRELLSFGGRSMIGSISPVETFRIDQLLVATLVSTPALGIYVVALSITNVPRFLADAISAVAYPEVARHPSQTEAWRLLMRYVALGGFACLSSAAVLALLAPTVLPLLFGDEYSGATRVSQVLLAAAGLVSSRRIMGDCLRGLGLTRAPTEAEIASWLPILLYAIFADVTLIGLAWAMAASGISGLSWLTLRGIQHHRGLGGEPR